MPAFDAIVIPGGGLLPSGEVPPWVANRLDRALSLDASYLIPLSAATIYKPAVLDGRGMPIFEAVAAARYLMDHGADPRRILPETASYDTVGNAYFCRAIHTEPRGLRRLHVITSRFHIERTETVFRWIFGVDPPSPAYDLSFEATADTGMDRGALAARYEKERAAARSARETAARYRTLAGVHEFLFAEHGIYAPAKWAQARHEASAPLLGTY